MELAFLNKTLKNELGKFYKTVLITGPWGVGKTYAIKQFSKDNNCYYVSMFGMESMDELKKSLYYLLNKNTSFFYKVKKNLSGFGLNVFDFGITLPQLNEDVNELLKSKIFQSKNITIIIDDLERKSEFINYSEILGFISWISSIDNINVIVIADETKIVTNCNKNDTKKCIFDVKNSRDYYNFKEKVINKTYKIKFNSDDAIKNICSKLHFKNSIVILEKSYKTLKIKNLRTLEKSINFLNYILQEFKYIELIESDLIKIFEAVLIVVDQNKIVDFRKEKENLIVNYPLTFLDDYKYNDIFYYISNYIIDDDIKCLKNLIDLFVVKEKVDEVITKKEFDSNLNKDIFYCSKDEVIERAEKFNNNFILNISDDLSIVDFLKIYNELKYYLELHNVIDFFSLDELNKAIDSYISKVDFNVEYNIDSIFFSTDNGLSNLDQKNIINKKINDEKLLKLLNYFILDSKYNKDNFDLYFTLLKRKVKYEFYNKTEDLSLYNIKFDFLIEDINNIMFLFPNVDNSISDSDWTVAHHICDEIGILIKDCKFGKVHINKVIDLFLDLSKDYNDIGKYRIKSLINQYIDDKYKVDN